MLGDPSNLALTQLIVRDYGWTPPEPRGQFDVLPVLLQSHPSQPPQMFEFPPWYVAFVSIQHSEEPWLAELALKWCSIPIVSAMELHCGGLVYTACPFSGWCAHGLTFCVLLTLARGRVRSRRGFLVHVALPCW